MTLQSAELDDNEVGNRAGYPLGSSERRAGGTAFAVLAMASSANHELSFADLHDGGIDGRVCIRSGLVNACKVGDRGIGEFLRGIRTWHDLLGFLDSDRL